MKGGINFSLNIHYFKNMHTFNINDPHDQKLFVFPLDVPVNWLTYERV